MVPYRLAVEALGWGCGWARLWAVPTVEPSDAGEGAPAPGRPPSVTVVVPARDEEHNLPCLLASLARQWPPPDEVVVVDDHSTDATAAVAAAAGALVVPSPRLPDGWTGKSWACWTGATHSSGEVLVFLDADTELEPGALHRLVWGQRRLGGLYSVQPYHRTVRAYEQLSAFFNLVGMMGVDAFGPRLERRRPRAAFGPCLVCARHDYLAVGGHRAVRGEVLEDVALAARFRGAGLAVSCRGGRGAVSFRMYPAGLRQLVEGWSKSFAAGAARTAPAALVLVVVWVTGALLAASSLLGGGTGPAGWPLAAAAAAYVLYAAQVGWMLSRVGRFRAGTAVAYPLPLVFFVAVFALSVLLTAGRGEVRWRGRTVPTARGRGRAGRRSGNRSGS